MGHYHYTPNADVAANTEIDLSGVLDGPMDVRDGNDPVTDAATKSGADDTSTAGTTVLGHTDLTSTGQGAADGPGAGEIIVTGPYTVALGDALDNNSLLVLNVEERGDVEKKL